MIDFFVVGFGHENGNGLLTNAVDLCSVVRCKRWVNMIDFFLNSGIVCWGQLRLLVTESCCPADTFCCN